MNRTVFFDAVRQSIYGGRLNSEQVDGLNTLLDIWLADENYSVSDPRYLAYCLATAHHETAATIQPIEEYGSDARANRMYGPEGTNPKRARRMGNTRKGDGAKYKGRGYVQLTWKVNYKKAGAVAGRDLVRSPALALEPNIAALALFQGCIEGWFTGKKLSDYIAGPEPDYRNARRVVNGTDKAEKIAVYAVKFERAIDTALREVLAEQPAPQPEPTKPNIFAIIAQAIGSIFKRKP